MIVGRSPGSGNLGILGTALAAFFWFFESAMHAFVLHPESGTFIQEVLSPAPHELYMRLVIVAVLIAFGVYAQGLVNRRRLAEASLAEANERLEREVIERKHAEEEIARAKEEWERTFDAVPDLISIVDTDHRIVRMNKAMAARLGIMAEDALGMLCFNCVHGLGAPLDHCPFRRLMADGREHREEIYEERLNGWFLVTVSPLQDSEGRLLGAIHVARDITVRRQMEDALRLAHGELEARVGERTAELAEANSRLEKEVEERKRAQEQLLHDAFHDLLTGLPNRALLLDRLAHAIDHWKRRESYILAVLILDIDHFKLINDSYGHSFGDRVLMGIAQRLLGSVRCGDTVARLGGDEFCILLDDLPKVSEAAFIAERIQEELRTPFHLDGKEIFVSGSIGIAASETKCEQPEELLRNADTAMYRAKASGRARHAMFDEQMHTQVVMRLQGEVELRRAVERGEFLVYYQPVIALATEELAGFEALVRWQHPERGLVPPMDFIPLAEETGLIIPIGLWVLREACGRMHDWHTRFPASPPLMIGVNLSGRQFAQPDLIDSIEEILQATNLDTGSLKLEITESVVMENVESTAVMLKRLKELGIQLSIDDFGTGYSSLSYLNRLPMDMLKVDRSFVSQVHMGNENYEIVRTIVNLAHTLGLTVVAEGPETKEQVDHLKALGCDYAQGYYYAQPMEKSVAESYIAERRPK